LLLHGRTRYSGASLVISFQPITPPAAPRIPRLVLSLISAGRDAVELTWSYSGDLSKVQDVQLSLRNLRTNEVEDRFPFIYHALSGHTQYLNGLASGTRYRATLHYRGKPGFAGASGSLEFETAAGPEAPPEPRLLSVAGSPEGLDLSWSWPGDPASISRIELSVINRATSARVFSTNLAATRREAGVTGLQPNTDYTVTVTYVARNGERSAAGANFATARSRVVLLLHGLFSNRTVWDSFIRSKHPQGYLTSGTVYGGSVHNVAPALNGVRYYTLNFGSKDKSYGRPGLENLAPYTSSGDFCSFEVLGEEVGEAVRAILGRHEGAELILVGHSRGGLAARAFLQNPSIERNAVIGLVTTGTPHRGSPYGRLYNYLKDNPREGTPHLPRRAYPVGDSNRYHKLLEVTLPEGFSPLFKGWANQPAWGTTGFRFQPPFSVPYGGFPSGFGNGGYWHDMGYHYGVKPSVYQLAPLYEAGGLDPGAVFWGNASQTTVAWYFATAESRTPELEVRMKDHRTWHVVDLARGAPINVESRKPGIGDLADGSNGIQTLNSKRWSLPVKGIRYRILYYDSGIELGSYPVWWKIGVNMLDWFSPTCQNYIFKGFDASFWHGDGTVPVDFQRLAAIGLPAGADVREIKGTGWRVYHTHQPAQTADLDSALREIAPSW